MRKSKFFHRKEQTTEINKNTIDDFLRELIASALKYSEEILPYQLSIGLSGGSINWPYQPRDTNLFPSSGPIEYSSG